MNDHTHSQYTVAEELAHAISHGAGVLLSIGGLSWMLYLSIEAADPWLIVASTVYGVSLIALFLASTLYHALHQSPHRPLFKLLDHCAIYLLIAGTYTPFLVIAMRTDTAWWMFGAIWSLATAGILTKLWFRHRFLAGGGGHRLHDRRRLLHGQVDVVQSCHLAPARPCRQHLSFCCRGVVRIADCSRFADIMRAPFPASPDHVPNRQNSQHRDYRAC